MKVVFASLDALDYLKSNLEYLTGFFKNDNSEPLASFIEFPLLLETKYGEIPDINLIETAPHPNESETDFENVKRLYSGLRFLSDSEASEERLWAGLSLGPFWNYTKYRWDIQEKTTADNINQHFFFGFNNRRSFSRNALARLWWIGRLTYDSNRSDPWELTEFVCKYSRFIEDILGRNTSNNPRIMKELISAIIQAQKDGAVFDTSMMRDIMKYLNLLGGIYILDCVPDGKIYEKIYAKVIELNNNKEAGQID